MASTVAPSGKKSGFVWYVNVPPASLRLITGTLAEEAKLAKALSSELWSRMATAWSFWMKPVTLASAVAGSLRSSAEMILTGWPSIPPVWLMYVSHVASVLAASWVGLSPPASVMSPPTPMVDLVLAACAATAPDPTTPMHVAPNNKAPHTLARFPPTKLTTPPPLSGQHGHGRLALWVHQAAGLY